MSWLAAVNLSEPSELIQQFEVNIIYLANFLFTGAFVYVVKH